MLLPQRFIIVQLHYSFFQAATHLLCIDPNDERCYILFVKPSLFVYILCSAKFEMMSEQENLRIFFKKQEFCIVNTGFCCSVNDVFSENEATGSLFFHLLNFNKKINKYINPS